MTQVTILQSRKGVEGFEVTGHSGYAEAGSDIVCSAISVLTQTAAIGLQELLKLSIALEVRDGEMICMLPRSMNPQTRREAELILKTMELGLRSVASTYKDYINISERTV